MTVLAGFKKAEPSTPRRRLVVCAEGMDKHGKTDWALTAPGPIAFQNFDNGLEGIIEKFLPIKEIHVSDYRDTAASLDLLSLDEGKTKAKFSRIWNRFMADYLTALRSPSIRSIIWDTGTEIWEVDRLGEFGKTQQILPAHYSAINAEFKTLIDMAIHSDKNLIILHRMKKQYRSVTILVRGEPRTQDSWTGKWERAGYADMGSRVQLKVLLSRDSGSGFSCTVLDSRQAPSLNGRTFSGDMCAFPYIAAEVFPTTTPLDWGLEEFLALGR